VVYPANRATPACRLLRDRATIAPVSRQAELIPPASPSGVEAHAIHTMVHTAEVPFRILRPPRPAELAGDLDVRRRERARLSGGQRDLSCGGWCQVAVSIQPFGSHDSFFNEICESEAKAETEPNNRNHPRWSVIYTSEAACLSPPGAIGINPFGAGIVATTYGKTPSRMVPVSWGRGAAARGMSPLKPSSHARRLIGRIVEFQLRHLEKHRPEGGRVRAHAGVSEAPFLPPTTKGPDESAIQFRRRQTTARSAEHRRPLQVQTWHCGSGLSPATRGDD